MNDYPSSEEEAEAILDLFLQSNNNMIKMIEMIKMIKMIDINHRDNKEIKMK